MNMTSNEMTIQIEVLSRLMKMASWASRANLWGKLSTIVKSNSQKIEYARGEATPSGMSHGAGRG